MRTRPHVNAGLMLGEEESPVQEAKKNFGEVLKDLSKFLELNRNDIYNSIYNEPSIESMVSTLRLSPAVTFIKLNKSEDLKKLVLKLPTTSAWQKVLDHMVDTPGQEVVAFVRCHGGTVMVVTNKPIIPVPGVVIHKLVGTNRDVSMFLLEDLQKVMQAEQLKEYL